MKNSKLDFIRSKKQRMCRLCGEEHKIGYVTFINKTTHLAMVCGNKNIYIPFEHALEIPSVLSKKAKAYNESQRDGLGFYLIERKKRTKDIIKAY